MVAVVHVVATYACGNVIKKLCPCLPFDQNREFSIRKPIGGENPW